MFRSFCAIISEFFDQILKLGEKNLIQHQQKLNVIALPKNKITINSFGHIEKYRAHYS